MNHQDYLQQLADLPGWHKTEADGAILRVMNLLNGLEVLAFEASIGENRGEPIFEVIFPGNRLKRLGSQAEIEAFVKIQTTAALALAPKYWAITFFWNKGPDREGTVREGGYDTVYTDRSPAEMLGHYIERGYTQAKLVNATPITKAQLDAEQTRLLGIRRK